MWPVGPDDGVKVLVECLRVLVVAYPSQGLIHVLLYESVQAIGHLHALHCLHLCNQCNVINRACNQPGM